AAVGDEAAVVAGGDDLVAPADDLRPGRLSVGFDLARCDALRSGPEGEGVDGGVVGGHDHDGLTGGPGGPPVGEGMVDHLFPGSSGDAAMRVVVIEDGLVAVAEPEGGGGFPGVA